MNRDSLVDTRHARCPARWRRMLYSFLIVVRTQCATLAGTNASKHRRRAFEPSQRLTVSMAGASFIALTQLATRFDSLNSWTSRLSLFSFLLALPILSACAMDGVGMFILSRDKPGSLTGLFILTFAQLVFFAGIAFLAASFGVWAFLSFLFGTTAAVWITGKVLTAKPCRPK